MICWALVIGLPVVLVPAAVWTPVWGPGRADNGPPVMGLARAAAVPAEVLLTVLYLALVSQLIGFFFWNAGHR